MCAAVAEDIRCHGLMRKKMFRQFHVHASQRFGAQREGESGHEVTFPLRNATVAIPRGSHIGPIIS